MIPTCHERRMAVTMEVIDNGKAGRVGRARCKCRTATFAESPLDIQKSVEHFL